jgi:hypothetical protein
MKKRPSPTEGPWIKLHMDLLCSAAWIAAKLPTRRAVERLLIEHMRHAGKDNGRLICTYNDFAEYGIRRPSIGPAIQQAVKLGLVVITERGHRSPDHNWPSRYRLTFLPTKAAHATDDWRYYDQINGRPLVKK